MTAPKTTPRPSDEALRDGLVFVLNLKDKHGWKSEDTADALVQGASSPLRPILDANDALHRRIAEVEGENATLRSAVSMSDEHMEMRAREVVAAGLPEDAKWLLAAKDKYQARATAAEARAARDAAEIERLRAGLRPFCFCDPALENILYGGMPDNAPATFTIKLADLRRARQALAEGDRNAEHG